MKTILQRSIAPLVLLGIFALVWFSWDSEPDHAHVAHEAMKAGRWAEAIREIDIAIDDEGELPAHLVLRGVARRRTGDLTGALADFTQALDEQERLVPAWLGRGVVRLEQEEWTLAEADFDEAVHWGPKLATVWRHRALARKGSGRLEEARDDLKEAVRLDPNDPYAWRHLGEVHASLGEESDAAFATARAEEITRLLAAETEAVSDGTGDPEGATRENPVGEATEGEGKASVSSR